MLINVYVASPDPDPNPRGGGQLPNPNECNSLTSGTNNIYPYPYIDVNDRGHRFRSGSPLTNYPHATSAHIPRNSECLDCQRLRNCISAVLTGAFWRVTVCRVT